MAIRYIVPDIFTSGAESEYAIQDIFTRYAKGEYIFQEITMSMADEQALGRLRQALSLPDPLEIIEKQVVTALGMWGAWTLDRQLWYLRKAGGLSQKELARRAGLTQARISRMEAGADFKWSTMAAVFSALGYEPMLLPLKPGHKREPRPYRQRWGDASRSHGERAKLARNRPAKRAGRTALASVSVAPCARDI